MAGIVEEELYQRLAHARAGAVLPCARSRRLLPRSSLFLRPCTQSSEPSAPLALRLSFWLLHLLDFYWSSGMI
jgi:hypothetical protein